MGGQIFIPPPPKKNNLFFMEIGESLMNYTGRMKMAPPPMAAATGAVPTAKVEHLPRAIARQVRVCVLRAQPTAELDIRRPLSSDGAGVLGEQRARPKRRVRAVEPACRAAFGGRLRRQRWIECQRELRWVSPASEASEACPVARQCVSAHGSVLLRTRSRA
jgi:hypothetical protein